MRRELEVNLIFLYLKELFVLGSRMNFKRSYKKGSPRPSNLDVFRLDLIRKIFSIEFASLINSKHLFINIDEASFSYKTKYDRSWLKRGWSNEVTNISFKGSQSIILGIASNGAWLASPLTKRNNSYSFLQFLQTLMKWIVFDLNIDTTNVILMMDNWSIHKTKKIISYLESTGWITVYIPAYTPTFAPVELIFYTLKIYLWKQCKDLSIELTGTEGHENIREALSSLSKDQINHSFLHSFIEIRDSLSSITNQE